ncbi:MAG: tRNA epoxyqueuosine(34) reductase QueG, partial [Chlamydiota bacterium]|nr:tRNA epoxyqueuosine(34) reductase QueG [Chlamydiota bacterium]
MSSQSQQEQKSAIKHKSVELGFDLIGFSNAEPTPDVKALYYWLEKGYGAELQYMYRNTEKRADPCNILPNAKTMISLALNYFSVKKNPCSSDRGNISNYAWGHDYHKIFTRKLKEFSNWIENEISPGSKTLSYVDTGPILEKSYAQQSGLGWIGKNTCLINRKYGSWIFLGEIITDLELPADLPEQDHCGTCTRCLEACPTHALIEPGVLDARLCISYLSIEQRGSLPETARPL